MTLEEFQKELTELVNIIFSMDKFDMESIRYNHNCSFNARSNSGYYLAGNIEVPYHYNSSEMFYNHKSAFYYTSRMKNEKYLPCVSKFMYEHASTDSLRYLLDKMKLLIVEKV